MSEGHDTGTAGHTNGGHSLAWRLRLASVVLATGALIVACVVCHVATGNVPRELSASLLVMIGWLCRDAPSVGALPFFRRPSTRAESNGRKSS